MEKGLNMSESRLLLIVEDDTAFARTLCRSFERRVYTKVMQKVRSGRRNTQVTLSAVSGSLI
jgi:ActR/RegA family two-component response regulator